MPTSLLKMRFRSLNQLSIVTLSSSMPKSFKKSGPLFFVPFPGAPESCSSKPHSPIPIKVVFNERTFYTQNSENQDKNNFNKHSLKNKYALFNAVESITRLSPRLVTEYWTITHDQWELCHDKNLVRILAFIVSLKAFLSLYNQTFFCFILQLWAFSQVLSAACSRHKAETRYQL